MFLVLMVVAPIILAVLFSTRWQTIGPGLVIPQLVLAPGTMPRGDNDGLWLLIFPELVVGCVLASVVAYVTASIVSARARRRVR